MTTLLARLAARQQRRYYLRYQYVSPAVMHIPKFASSETYPSWRAADRARRRIRSHMNDDAKANFIITIVEHPAVAEALPPPVQPVVVDRPLEFIDALLGGPS
jgi:hypothetical protein